MVIGCGIHKFPDQEVFFDKKCLAGNENNSTLSFPMGVNTPDKFMSFLLRVMDTSQWRCFIEQYEGSPDIGFLNMKYFDIGFRTTTHPVILPSLFDDFSSCVLELAYFFRIDESQ